MQSLKQRLLPIAVALALVACSDRNPDFDIPTQQWQEVVIEVQTRPTSLQVGMNEFLVLTTSERGRPIPDYIISLRLDQAQPWQQAIQDGLSGVYRRAAFVPAGASTLYLQLKQKKSAEVKEFSFPLVLSGQ